MSNAPALPLSFLAGGIGKRLHPFTIDKTLIPSVASHWLNILWSRLPRIGGRKVIMVTNGAQPPLGDWIPNLIRNYLFNQINPKQTVWRCCVCSQLENKVNSPVIIMNEVDRFQIHSLPMYSQRRQLATFWSPASNKPNILAAISNSIKTESSLLSKKPAEGTQPSNFC